jgi:secreted PhoX family phosphatase
MKIKRFAAPVAVALVAALVATGAAAKKRPPGSPQTDPAGIIDLPAGYSYKVIATSCATPVRLTESGRTDVMPEDFDANVLVRGAGGRLWLLSNHELTQPRAGDFQGDAGKCHVDEQTPGDDDSDGWGSVSRITLGKDGSSVQLAEVITTGLHNLCAGALTPWKTFLTNEEFPFLADPQQRSGWVWEVDPRTGKATRATGMGRFSHEQEARVGKAWVLTDDRGNYQYLYKFVPNRARDLASGKLYGLVFDRSTNTGHWVGPLNPLNPEGDMVARVGPPNATTSFEKAEGIVRAHGNAVVFSESGATAHPGRVWLLRGINKQTVRGRVLAEGNFATMSHPDNLRFNNSGDLYIMEDNGPDLVPRAGGVNEIWILPKKGGALVRFASTKSEPTGPWFSHNGKRLYLSLQGAPSRVIVIDAAKKRGKK